MEIYIAIILFLGAIAFVVSFYAIIDWFDNLIQHRKWRNYQRKLERRRKLQSATNAQDDKL